MTARLTKKFLSENNVIFFPQTKAEAVFIQRCLFALGQKWKNSGKKLVEDAQNCIDDGILVMNGTIYTLPTEGATNHFTGVICDVNALSAHFNASTATLERRVKDLEKQVAALTDVLTPSVAVKPALVKKAKAG